MAFAVKIDYCALVAKSDGALSIRDDAENASSEKYQPTGGDGAYADLEVYGDDAAPSNSYALAADLELDEGDLQGGKVNTVDGKKYMLESVNWSTTGGSAPTISATSQLVESSATDGCLFDFPALDLKARHHAQDAFGILNLTGAGCQFTTIGGSMGCKIDKNKNAGVILTSDPIQGVATCTGTILQTGSTPPTLALKQEATTAGWVITRKPTCTNPESAKKSYTFTVERNLTKTLPATT